MTIRLILANGIGSAQLEWRQMDALTPSGTTRETRLTTLTRSYSTLSARTAALPGRLTRR